MRQIRCHIDSPLAVGSHLALPAHTTNHLLRVLRLSVGDRISLFNGDGRDYSARILTGAKSGAEVEILDANPVRSESPLRIHLGQALARGEKMDWVLQKATELGVTAITPLITQRSEVKLSGERAEKRQRHWQGVIASACEQCGRATLPSLGPIGRLGDWCGEVGDTPGWYLEPTAKAGLGSLSPECDASLRLVIGPEGGFDDIDIATLQAAGFRGLRLGPRVLRTETAGPAVIAALQALFGDLRG
ncbi:MAG: 16S rRNA (uracil(1498)-N(3))-methyltransferase [Xanthomonadales bacterium]|nr:16S rRNA (uracil(1498)-N(3))-methyltransferase [Xanthomonadales bacterium]